MAQNTTAAPRIAPREARQHLDANPSALLVCAYDDLERFERNQLEGATPLADIEANAGSLHQDRELIFYCACPGEATSARVAGQYRDEGFRNARALAGGVAAWKKAGYAVVPPGPT